MARVVDQANIPKPKYWNDLGGLAGKFSGENGLPAYSWDDEAFDFKSRSIDVSWEGVNWGTFSITHFLQGHPENKVIGSGQPKIACSAAYCFNGFFNDAPVELKARWNYSSSGDETQGKGVYIRLDDNEMYWFVIDNRKK